MAYGLRALGNEAVAALALLLKDEDSQVRRLAAESLAHGGKEAVGPLTEALKDPHAATREEAVRSLGRIGPDARDAVPASQAIAADAAAEFPPSSSKTL